MTEVKEVLLRLAKGESKKAIKRSLGVHRQTINRYLELAKLFGVDPTRDGEETITDELIQLIAAADQERKRERSVCPVEELLVPLKPKIEAYIETGLKGSKILELLRREGIVPSKSAFYRFLGEYCTPWIRKKITVRLPETEPGQYAQCDFGRLGKLWDETTERERIVYGLIVTLCYSGHQYVYVTFKQDLEAVIQGCEQAFAYFGGVPQILIFDNLKPVVTKSDRYTPRINTVFLEYAQYRKFIVDPTCIGSPKGKPVVERIVPYVRDNFFAGERFINLEDCQGRAVDWCTNTAGRRIHQTTKRVPTEVFESTEKQSLQPYDGRRYDIPHWAICKVHPDHHIRFRNALYSVPTGYVGKQVDVQGDSALVRIYFQGVVIKVHKTMLPGKRSTDYNDYPKELTPYALRNPIYQIQEGHKRHPVIGRYIESILAGPYPWHHLRSAQKLLRLSDQYSPARVAAACQKAQAYSVYDIRRIERMLKNNLEETNNDCQETLVSPFVGKLRFAREEMSFNHYKLNRR